MEDDLGRPALAFGVQDPTRDPEGGHLLRHGPVDGAKAVKLRMILHK